MKNPAVYIDHTNIAPDATKASILKTCDEAKHFGFRGVCVNPEWINTAAKSLYKTKIKLTVLIDPPMGQRPHSERKNLCQAAKKNGADELDIVANIIDIKYGRYEKVLRELKEICSILPTKVIIGTGYLITEEIRKTSMIVQEAGAMCVKTSTYKDPLDYFELGEKARHVRLMKESAPDIKVKAAGKIRTFDDLKLMVESGADIIGTSSSVQIMNGWQDKYAE